MGRRNYPTPGWENKPVDWSWSVGFKKPGSGRLRWVDSGTKDERAASGIARGILHARGPSAHVEYGLSKTYYRDWGGYREVITQAEYEEALRRTLVPRS